MNSTPAENEALAGVGPQFVLHSYREMLTARPAKWMAKGLIPDEGVGVLFGASGSGKTFLVLNLALSIARGVDFAGFKVPRPRPVVYCAVEAGAGINKRLKAAHIASDEPAGTQDPNLHVLLVPFDLTDNASVKALGDVIVQRCGTGVLVVIDTLNRAAPGIDENSSQGIGMVLKGAQDLAAQVGGLVLLIHHSGKDSSKGMRGSSALHAGVDVAIEVVADGALRTLKVAKNKDGEAGQQRAFSLQSVEVGVDDDLDPITSCVVKFEQGSGRSLKDPSGKNQAPVLQALKDEFQRSTQQHEGVPTLTHAEAVAVATAALKELNCDRPAERAKDALKGLVGVHLRQCGSALKVFYTLA